MAKIVWLVTFAACLEVGVLMPVAIATTDLRGGVYMVIGFSAGVGAMVSTLRFLRAEAADRAALVAAWEKSG